MAAALLCVVFAALPLAGSLPVLLPPAPSPPKYHTQQQPQQHPQQHHQQHPGSLHPQQRGCVAFDPVPPMRQALAVAREIKARGGFPFSAVIMNASSCPPMVLASGSNNSTYNAIWHAEMVAMTNLSNLHPTTPVASMGKDLVLVVTAELTDCDKGFQWPDRCKSYKDVIEWYLLRKSA